MMKKLLLHTAHFLSIFLNPCMDLAVDFTVDLLLESIGICCYIVRWIWRGFY